MSDPIDAAIAAAATAPTTTLREVRVQIASSGRPVILLVPDDLDDVEIIELAGFVLLHLRPSLAAPQQQAAPASRLFVPGRPT